MQFDLKFATVAVAASNLRIMRKASLKHGRCVYLVNPGTVQPLQYRNPVSRLTGYPAKSAYGASAVCYSTYLKVQTLHHSTLDAIATQSVHPNKILIVCCQG